MENVRSFRNVPCVALEDSVALAHSLRGYGLSGGEVGTGNSGSRGLCGEEAERWLLVLVCFDASPLGTTSTVGDLFLSVLCV